LRLVLGGHVIAGQQLLRGSRSSQFWVRRSRANRTGSHGVEPPPHKSIRRRDAEGSRLNGRNAARFNTIMMKANRYMPIARPIITCIMQMATSQKLLVAQGQIKT